MLRTDYKGVRQGINKCRDAIENSLSKTRGFSLMLFEKIIKAMSKYPQGFDEWNTWDNDDEKKVLNYQKYLEISK